MSTSCNQITQGCILVDKKTIQNNQPNDGAFYLCGGAQVNLLAPLWAECGQGGGKATALSIIEVYYVTAYV